MSFFVGVLCAVAFGGSIAAVVHGVKRRNRFLFFSGLMVAGANLYAASMSFNLYANGI